MANTLALGASAVRLEGSSPSLPTHRKSGLDLPAGRQWFKFYPALACIVRSLSGALLL